QIIVAPSVASTLLKSLVWVGVIGAGILLLVLGGLLLLIGLLRRRRNQPVTVPVQPAGWFADPRGEASLRWWDGTQWTEHIS
ncbi:MAG TPA: DUF2510 domain-containing protein, partial [Actinomycetes bacterium]|nr:DUF2510 domain-containing protein [Actinomycetes bacterium]